VDVITLMGPEIEKAKAVGVTALGRVQYGAVWGAGRILTSPFRMRLTCPSLSPTGIYREPWVPELGARRQPGVFDRMDAGRVAGSNRAERRASRLDQAERRR